MELRTAKLKDIKPYPNNPRINDDAVEAVAESIKQCGYVSPIVVDENMVILAGHTRYKALKKLGYKECPYIFADDLNEEQKRKFRLLDNKTSEFAMWDEELLEIELDGLDFEGFDFGFDFGFETQENDRDEEETHESKYTDAINIPQYEPSGECPKIEDIYDDGKYRELIKRIYESSADGKTKDFLILAASRHIAFNYKKIADFYAHADAETQNLMEESALVIIDLDDAIRNGYAELTKKLDDIEALDYEE